MLWCGRWACTPACCHPRPRCPGLCGASGPGPGAHTREHSASRHQRCPLGTPCSAARSLIQTHSTGVRGPRLIAKPTAGDAGRPRHSQVDTNLPTCLRSPCGSEALMPALAWHTPSARHGCLGNAGLTTPRRPNKHWCSVVAQQPTVCAGWYGCEQLA